MRRFTHAALIAATLFAAQVGNAQEPEAKPAAEAAKPAENAEAKPAENAEAKPAEAKPAENAEAKPSENAEAKPAENAEAKPAENAEAKPGAEVAKPEGEPHGAEAPAHAAPAGHGEHGAVAAHGAAAAHGDSAAHGEGAAHHPHGIVNWWSWDYGPAAKDPTHRGWPPPFGFALINFGIFLAVMWRIGGRSLVEFVAARHERIKKELDEAGRLHREAEARLAELQSKLSGLDKDVAEIVATVRKEAEEEKQRILAAANEQAARVQQEAERQIAAEVERQRKELSRLVVEAAIKQAEAIVQKNFGPEDHRRTSEAYVAQLEKGAS